MKAVLALVLLAAVAAQAQITFSANNFHAHNTDMYRGPDGKPTKLVILRRNEQFTAIHPTITTGSTFSLELGTESVPLAVVKAGAGSAEVKHTQGAIGRFKLVIKTGASRVDTSVIFIANPWESADETFVPNPSGVFPPEIAEHVLNERGALWQGSSRSNGWIPWAFNQFDDMVVQTTVDLLDGMNMKQRASTALVVRYLTSQSMNVLRGRWDGEYSDGKQPGFWASSTQIIAQYQKTKSVVKYGQCWVFAGLLTALCRSIGVPSRPLTNFDSAHEHQPFDQVCNTKYRKTASGYEKIDADNSIWNFHVWVDAWMKRPDIAGGAGDGWQAIDATPQEQSSGPNERPFSQLTYRCGPAAHSLLRAKNYNAGYDAPFIAGESNCVKVDWVDNKEVSRDANLVGEMMLTKSPDSICDGEQVDAQGGYKRLCVSNLARSYSVKDVSRFLQIAARMGAKSAVVPPQCAEPAERYKILIKSEVAKKPQPPCNKPDQAVYLGKAFTIDVMPGTATGEAVYTAILSANSYDSKKNWGVLVQQSGPGPIRLSVSRADWALPAWKNTVPSKTQSMELLVVVEPKVGTPFVKRISITVQLPKLAMLCGPKHRRGGVVACNVQAWNPLPYELSNARMSFTISGQSSQAEQEQWAQSNQNVVTKVGGFDGKEMSPASRASFSAKFRLDGASGPQMIVAKFSSDQLDGIIGVMEIMVEPDGANTTPTIRATNRP